MIKNVSDLLPLLIISMIDARACREHSFMFALLKKKKEYYTYETDIYVHFQD